MIFSVRGKIIFKEGARVVIEVNNIGYEIKVTNRLAEKLSPEKEAFLYCHQYVRENALELYGFSAISELKIFEMLISVSGIGPRSALSVLEVAEAEELEQAIASQDPKMLTRVAGIGSKLAGRIILELKNRLAQTIDQETLTKEMDVIEGLINLGYTRKQAREALKTVPKEISDPSKRLTEALKRIGGK